MTHYHHPRRPRVTRLFRGAPPPSNRECLLAYLDELGLHGLKLAQEHPLGLLYLAPLYRLALQPLAQGLPLVCGLRVGVEELLHVFGSLLVEA